MAPAEKNQVGFKVIAPRIENKKVATKKEVKSLKSAFWASLDNWFKIKPNSAAAMAGVKIQLRTNPSNKYA